MKHIPVLLSIALLHLLAVSTFAETVRVSGAVYRSGATNSNIVDEALTDLLVVELAQQEQVEVLERRQLQLVLGEMSLGALTDDAWRQTRLGRLLGVDVFAWIELRGDRAVLQVVEAATGRGIAVSQVALGDDSVATIKSLARQAAHAARQGPVAIDANAPTLAIAKPVFEQPNDTLSEATESALIVLEQQLKRAGVTMLSRRFLDDQVLERWMMDKGLTDAQRRKLPMLGARYVLTVRVPAGTSQPAVSLLETKTGRRVGYRTWVAAEMADWIMRRLDPQSQPNKRQTLPQGDTPLQPETLGPFYRGVLLHNQGMYLDATEHFREAMRRDRQFIEPYRWMQSCFVGAGFDELDQTLGEYVDRAPQNVWHSVHSPKALHTEPGVALVGLTTAPTVAPALQVPATMLLIDALHEATGVPVFVTSDMAELRDEFDALVGLENVAGTTWQQAPAMLFADTLTAHIETSTAGLRLRLCVTHRHDPSKISAVTIDLPQDHRQWQKQITEAGRDLLAQAAEQRVAWQRPPLLLGPADVRAKELIIQNFTVLRYVKCVARDGEFADNLRYPHSTDWLENVLQPALHRWFIRTLPDDSPVKPEVEFAYVNHYTQVPDWFPAMEALGRKYDGNPVGTFAQINALLYGLELDEASLRRAQAKLEQLLLEPHLRRAAARSKYDFGRYWDTNRLMRRALGMMDTDGELNPGSRSWALLAYGSPIRINAGGTFPGTIEFPGPPADLQQRALVDLAMLRCTSRKERDIPADTVKEVFDRFADEPNVQAYFSISNSNKIFTNFSQATSKDDLRTLAKVYPMHARAVVEILKRDPLPFNRQQVGFLVGVHPFIDRLKTELPEYRKARGDIKRAVFELIDSGRLGELGPMDIFALLIDISPGRDDPEMVPYLKTLADRSLASDPSEDRYWRILTHWLRFETPAERMQYYLPYYERIRKLHPTPTFNRSTLWLYYDFGVVFFRGGRFDLADEALSTIALAEREGSRHLAEAEFNASTYYLLALLRQRDRNIPEALRYAKLAVDEITNGELSNDQIGFITGVGITGGRHGSGSVSNLKSMATDLMARLRSNPDAPFKPPF